MRSVDNTRGSAVKDSTTRKSNLVLIEDQRASTDYERFERILIHDTQECWWDGEDHIRSPAMVNPK